MIFTVSSIILISILGLINILLVMFGFVSLREKELRVARISFVTATIGVFITLIIMNLSMQVQNVILIIALIITLLLVALIVFPFGKVDHMDETPKNRVDERDIMFSRSRLKPSSIDFESYYKANLDKRLIDDQIRALPGLCSKNSRFYDPLLFSSVAGSSFLIESIREAVDGEPVNSMFSMPPEELTPYLLSLARFYGAIDAGVASMKPYHYYSHVGRGSGNYGDRIDPDFPFGIVFTVEMYSEMVAAAPKPAVMMESTKQYVEAARIAIQLAASIRELGYHARAHIDSNYRVIAPLVARDAGLGEIGRMGILITPKKGPRVRLAVVTTDIPLITNGRNPSQAVIDFCSICKKCADCCPSQSIPFDDRKEIDGSLHWKIDAESCFRYWNTVGTDCGRCMAVCPFSHPDNIFHNFIRFGIDRSGFFRRVANKLDGFLYGQKPGSRLPPEWVQVTHDQKFRIHQKMRKNG